MNAAEVTNLLQEILGEDIKVVPESSLDSCALLHCHMQHPVDVRLVRQAVLAMDNPRAALRVDSTPCCVLEIPLALCSESEDDGNDSAEDNELAVLADDIEYDLSYCDNSSAVKQVIQALYSLCHGIKVYADRRKCTTTSCCLIVDNVRTMYMEAVARALLENLAHFILSIKVIATKRLCIHVRLPGSKKRKRA